MAFEVSVLNITRIAASDLSTKQYRAVKVDTTVTDGITTAGAAEQAIGILQEPAKQGQPASVMVLGISMAVYGESVTGGAKLTTDANGALVPVTTTEPVVAIALESGAAGEVHAVLLK